MAGIYLHIPFCKQACHYCNFHFSTSLKYKDKMLLAIEREIERQRDYLAGERLESIYFGGGTPSILQKEDIQRLLEKIYSLHEVQEKAEITLEANPDDLSPAFLKALSQTTVNRLSIGIQSFSSADLVFMNRAHNATEAKKCIQLAKEYGFDNLTVDLIYGSPSTSDQQWEENIEIILDFDIAHLSCYCLTVEPKTALEHFVNQGKVKAVDEEQAERQFIYLIDRLEKAGYEHYEISNFAKPGARAIHNSNYWLGKKYLGIGPSAHSFNGYSRQWNPANNAKYIKAMLEDNRADIWYELEELSAIEQYNEYVMTRLRTVWGVELTDIAISYQNHFLEEVAPFVKDGHVMKSGDRFHLSKSGKLLADRIAMELFV